MVRAGIKPNGSVHTGATRQQNAERRLRNMAWDKPKRSNGCLIATVFILAAAIAALYAIIK